MQNLSRINSNTKFERYIAYNTISSTKNETKTKQKQKVYNPKTKQLFKQFIFVFRFYFKETNSYIV